ncbi:MAG: DUF748 domain-containing protein [Candidatus Omnitrophica bacterium]|nr:DUF748 domain-containing protein [Candidatus Omnitrophota bacterium]
MKKLKKIILWVAIIVVVLLIILNLAVNIFGKGIITSQIRENLNMSASLKGISVSLPLAVNLSGLEIGDLVQVKRISLSPSLLGFLAGKIVLNRLSVVEPVVTIVRSEDGQFNLPQLKQKGKPPEVLLAGLVIKNGTIKFIDKKVDPRGHGIFLQDLNVSISKVSLPPTSLFTRYRILADIVDPKGKKLGNVSGSGWIDFGPKDMDGNFKLEDVEATYFTPYCRDFFSETLGQKNLESAKLNFNADLKAKDDALKVACRLSLSDLVYRKDESSQGKESFPDKMPNILNVFLNKAGKVDLNFNIDTKLSQPNFNILKIASGALKKNIAEQPPEKTMENISNVVDQFKAIGKNLKDMWKKKEE